MKGASDPIRNGIFLEKDLQKAAELIVDWLKARGYLFACLVIKDGLSHKQCLQLIPPNSGRLKRHAEISSFTSMREIRRFCEV